jgi:RecB family endonuclease NucS
VSRGHEKAVGQLLTYIGWVRKDLADGKPVRGIIVAHKATDELVAAVQEVSPKIALFEYEISFQVRPVSVC